MNDVRNFIGIKVVQVLMQLDLNLGNYHLFKIKKTLRSMYFFIYQY